MSRGAGSSSAEAARDRVAPAGPIDHARMRAFRLARARAAMERHGLDAILGFEYANGRYLADLRPLWAPNFLVRQAAVIGRAADRVICFVHQDDTPHRRSTMPWLDPSDIREFPTGLVNAGTAAAGMRPLVEALADLGVTSGRVGIDILTPAVLDNLVRALPAVEFVDVGPAMREARTVKNEDELELMRFASRVSDATMAAAIGAIEPGMRECDVLAVAMGVLYRNGAEVPQCNLIVASGPNTMPMQRFAGERAIEPGDLVMLDLGGCFGGVFSELARTTVCGEAHPRQREIYRAAVDILETTIGALHGGTTAAAVQAAAGGPYDASPFAGRMQRMIIAHGIGVGYAEAPFIPPPGGPPASNEPLPSGVTLAVVPTLLVPDVPGGGGVRLEDVVALTPDGVERLTRHPFERRLLD
jgi:Xaa-Pro aminopeptidase